MLKTKTRMTAPLGMGLLLVSLTAIPLSLAFHSTSPGSVESSPTGVNDLIGPWWPFAYVLDKEAGQTETPGPVPTPGSETHVAGRDLEKQCLEGPSNLLSFRFFSREYERFDTVEEFANLPCPDAQVSTPPITSIHSRRRPSRGRLLARQRAMSEAVAYSATSPAARLTHPVLSAVATRELKVYLVKLAVLINEVTAEQMSLTFGKTESGCDEAETKATEEERTGAELDKQEDLKKLRQALPEEICYPELLAEPVEPIPPEQ